MHIYIYIYTHTYVYTYTGLAVVIQEVHDGADDVPLQLLRLSDEEVGQRNRHDRRECAGQTVLERHEPAGDPAQEQRRDQPDLIEAVFRPPALVGSAEGSAPHDLHGPREVLLRDGEPVASHVIT